MITKQALYSVDDGPISVFDCVVVEWNRTFKKTFIQPVFLSVKQKYGGGSPVKRTTKCYKVSLAFLMFLSVYIETHLPLMESAYFMSPMSLSI